MAKPLIVSYDLRQQGQNYKCIIEKLESYPVHWHMQGSVWILVTDDKASQVRDSLKSCLDSNDKLFVGRLSGEAAWHGHTNEANKWIKSILE